MGHAKKPLPADIIKNEQAMKEAQAKQEELMLVLADAYAKKLDTDMGRLHEQFVAFISVSKIPLPQVLLVLQMLERETVDEAYKMYLGG